MPPRRTQRSRPTSLRVASGLPGQRVEIFEPTLGFDRSQPAVDLRPGQTPDADNFVIESGFLKPRSGLSQFGDTNTNIFSGDVVLNASEYHDVDGSANPVLVSAQTIATFGVGGAASWSTLSYVLRYSGAAADQLSGNSLQTPWLDVVYEPISDENWLVVTNGVNTPKVAVPSQGTYSDLSDFISVESTAKFVYSLDNRLCFWHCADSATTFATRVRWSERGNTSKFSTIGAGFEDLMDATGEGTGVVVREGDALLFTEHEIWVQRPRRDAFAFNFFALDRSTGTLYGRTIQKTPIGVIFLSTDLQFYLVRGSEIIPIGEPVQREIRDNIKNADLAFAVYNRKQRRYEFYYVRSSDADRPGHAFYLDIDTLVWMPQSFPFEVSAGVETPQSVLDDFFTIDELVDPLDDITSTLDGLFTPGSKSLDHNMLLASSAGTAYRFIDGQNTDAGSTITAQWTSHALTSDDRTREFTLNELWVEYEAESASSLSVLVRGDQTRSFQATVDATLAQQPYGTIARLPAVVSGRRPQFRLQINDAQRPRIARMIAKLRDAGQQ